MSRGAAAAFVLRASGMALGAITAVVLARALGPAGYGTYSWGFALITALAVPAVLGADQLLVREAAVASDRSEWSRLRSLLRSALTWSAAAAGVAVAAAAALLAVAGDGLGTRQTALLVALPILPLAALTALGQGALLGLGRTAAALAPGTAGRQFVFLALVAIAVTAGGLSGTGALALQLAATAVAAVITLALARGVLSGAASSRAGRASPREWLRTSIPMGAAGVLLALDATVGLLALGAFGSASAAGVYAAALQCTAPFVLLLAAVRLPLAPAIARLGAAGQRERLQRGLRTATRAVAAPIVLVVLVLLVFPGQVLDLFGDGFSDGAAALRLLAVAQLVNALNAFNGTALIMNGEERAAMRAAFGCLVLDVVLCLLLVPSFGARGAAIAALASVTVRNVAVTMVVRRRLGLDATVLGRLPTAATRP